MSSCRTPDSVLGIVKQISQVTHNIGIRITTVECFFWNWVFILHFRSTFLCLRLFSYIWAYNTTRLHSTLGYVTPKAYAATSSTCP